MDKDCGNCSHSGKPSYEWPCTACTSAYGSAPSMWEGLVPASADMVEVVRCKDCAWCHQLEDLNYCENPKAPWIDDPDFDDVTVADNDFCSYGERRTDD